MIKVLLLRLVLALGLVFFVQACSDANAESTEVPEKPVTHENCCKLVESSPIWMSSSLCPKESGWVSKGLGVDKHGNWKALCAKVTLSCSCPAEN